MFLHLLNDNIFRSSIADVSSVHHQLRQQWSAPVRVDRRDAVQLVLREDVVLLVLWSQPISDIDADPDDETSRDELAPSIVPRPSGPVCCPHHSHKPWSLSVRFLRYRQWLRTAAEPLSNRWQHDLLVRVTRPPNPPDKSYLRHVMRPKCLPKQSRCIPTPSFAGSFRCGTVRVSGLKMPTLQESCRRLAGAGICYGNCLFFYFVYLFVLRRSISVNCHGLCSRWQTTALVGFCRFVTVVMHYKFISRARFVDKCFFFK